MKIQATAKLIGVMGKKGSMTNDRGEPVSWDKVELHCLADLDSAKGGIGQTVQIYSIPDVVKNENAGKALVGKDIMLELTQVSDGKGSAPKLQVVSFMAVK